MLFRAEYKFINFRRNIAQVQPALAILKANLADVGVCIILVIRSPR
jgi:hypothetical protein